MTTTQNDLERLVARVPHRQRTVWKDGIDIEECWPDCVRCGLDSALGVTPQRSAAVVLDGEYSHQWFGCPNCGTSIDLQRPTASPKSGEKDGGRDE